MLATLKPSSVLQVTVQVEDVNEAPQFPSTEYEASVFSIAPYKTSIITVKVKRRSLSVTQLLNDLKIRATVVLKHAVLTRDVCSRLQTQTWVTSCSTVWQQRLRILTWTPPQVWSMWCQYWDCLEVQSRSR